MNTLVLTSIELLKTKRMPIGTISRGRKKVAEGRWVPVKQGTKKKPVKKKPTLADALKLVEDSIAELDHERCYAFDAAGKGLMAKDGEESQIEFSLEEMEKLKRADVFTHNHPSGGSFSSDDMKFAYFLDIKELRVTSRKYSYSVELRNVGRQAMPWSVFAEIIDEKNRQTRRTYERKISDGKMSIKQAEASHWHNVWGSVSEAVDGFQYQRTNRKK